MLFERRLQAGLTDGSIRVAFRRWRRPRVGAGYSDLHDLLRDLKGPLERKLARLDAAPGRTWTRATLEPKEAQPGRRAGALS